MSKQPRGIIRFILGLLLVYGAVGGMDHNPQGPLLVQLAIAVIGLALMAWAAVIINRRS